MKQHEQWRDNVHFILVHPREPGNIGASARAIKNMGFSNLSLVGAIPDINDEARWLAHQAQNVLTSAVICNDLKDAISEKALVSGTSRRKGRKRGMFVSVDEGARRLFQVAPNNKVAILFGREDRGLRNEEIEECGFLMTIPSSASQPSLNLAQAVLIVAYELHKASLTRNYSLTTRQGRTPSTVLSDNLLVRQEELSRLYERAEDILKMLDYLPRGDRDLARKMMQNIKHFIGRAGLKDWELRMLHGICTQIERKIPPSDQET